MGILVFDWSPQLINKICCHSAHTKCLKTRANIIDTPGGSSAPTHTCVRWRAAWVYIGANIAIYDVKPRKSLEKVYKLASNVDFVSLLHFFISSLSTIRQNMTWQHGYIANIRMSHLRNIRWCTHTGKCHILPVFSNNKVMENPGKSWNSIKVIPGLETRALGSIATCVHFASITCFRG